MDPVKLIQVKEDIRADNKLEADELREQLAAHKTFLLNLMSSPGAGKTTTIVRTLEALHGVLRCAVIEADIASTVDADRLAERGIGVVQLQTGGFCHLDASMVKKGLDALDLDGLDAVIIENIGNLVCPAEFDTGAVRNVMILSVPEGDDKPFKYPLMFTVCDVLLVNKIDYLALSEFDVRALEQRVRNLNPDIEIFQLSAKTGQGFQPWVEWLRGEVNRFVRPMQ